MKLPLRPTAPLLVLLAACGAGDPPPTAGDPGAAESIRDAEPSFARPVRAPEGSPNFVIVLADDLGFADLGSFGSEIETPNLDALAARGLRYNQFTATAVCSASRAALLTGLNHHSAGSGWLAEWDFGFPGYRGEIPVDVATLPEILREHGFSTLMVGKWHLTNQEHRSPIGPFDSWPTSRGFDRFFGFLDGETSQWHPHALVRGNEILPPPEDPGFYLPDALTERALAMLRELRAHDATRPFLLYYASGTPHAPHHTRAEDRARYRGRYDRGWDEVRRERLARQKQLGVAPPGAELAEHNPGVVPWAELSPEQRRMYARFQENYAAYVDDLDRQVGRIVAHLEAIGELENTVFLFTSDNGASREVGVGGSANNLDFYHGRPLATEENLASYDAIGDASTHPHYPHGWMEVSNTPFRHAKRTVQAGGVRVPLILCWPLGIRRAGEVRSQFHHVDDLAPTLLEIAGIDPPARVSGETVRPIEGVSLVYSFEDPAAPSRKREQYYEMEGHRGFYADGWRLVSYREPEQRFDDAPWQLFHTAEDFAERSDVAAAHPDRVAELEQRWWEAARTHAVLPLIDVPLLERARYSAYLRETAPQRFVYHPGAGTLQRFKGPLLPNRSYTITADVVRESNRDDGVLVALGDLYSGMSLFVRDGRLVYEQNVAYDRIRLVSTAEVPVGRSTLRFQFRKDPILWAALKGLVLEGPDFDRLRVLAGTGALFIGDQRVAEGWLPRPVFAVWEGMDVGRDSNTPVSPLYAAPFPFRGTLERVVFELE